MKKFFAGAAILGMAAFASAQTISFDRDTYDYGTIQQNANGERVFKVTNKGDKPLIISKVQPGCGCTVPSWSQDPIMPGKTAEIKVGYNTANVGQFAKNIEVYSNDPQNSRVNLTIKGNVEAGQTQVAPVAQTMEPANVKPATATTTATKKSKTSKKPVARR